MNSLSYIKHSIFFIGVISLMTILAFSLEKSEINDITIVKLSGNKYLEASNYLRYARLENIEEYSGLSMNLIKDRLDKHPYIKNTDVVILERGVAEVTIFEKKMDAILLNKEKQFMITNRAEIIPLVPSTMNLNLPVIIYNSSKNDFKLFNSAVSNGNLLSALKIITTAELYDKNLHRNISEVVIENNEQILVYLSKITSPIYFGKEDEIKKTVFLSKIFKHLDYEDLNKYLNYVDLRYNELVYLGFDEQLKKGKEAI